MHVQLLSGVCLCFTIKINDYESQLACVSRFTLVTQTENRTVRFLARDVIYTSRAYAMMPIRLSIRLSVTEVH